MSDSQTKWYDKTWLVILLVIIFFPIGLYALWNNSTIKRGWKVSVTVIIAVSFIAYTQTHEPPDTVVTPKIERKLSDRELVEAQFGGWDHSHIKLEQIIIASMNDADSYEHVETKYILDTKNSIFVTTKFRGKNAFGAKVLNQMSARFSLDGSLLEIIK